MQWVLWVALASSIAFLFIPWGELSNDLKKWLKRAIVILQIQPFIVLTFLFVSDSTSFDIVRLYGGGEMPLLYRISAVWGGREGPTLLWAGFLALCGLFFQNKGNEETDITFGKMINGVISTLFLLALIMRPFRLAQSSWGGELNPLLQTDLMVIHPPLVFLYYSLCMVVTLKALAFILTEGVSERTKVREYVLPSARAAFAVGTLGIGLGGLWAYTVLDWGGYWAWDPVETASLLPWLSLLLLLHLRVNPAKDTSKWAVPLAILPGWFSIHATMVTRANGVWASVHAFIGDETDGRSDSAIGRLIELQGQGIAGTEVTTYLASLVVILSITVAWLIIAQSDIGDQKRWRKISQYSFFMLPLIPLSRFISIDLLGSEKNWVELLPPAAILLFASTSLIVLLWPPKNTLPELFDNTQKSLSMVAILLLSYFIEDYVVGFLLCIVMLLKASVRNDSDNVWTITGITIILTATYAFLIEVSIAGIAMLIFLWPVLTQGSDEEEQPLLERLSKFTTRKVQLRLARYTPVVIGAIFLTLTWMLMLASIDGASLGMHEMFGSPLILIVAAGLATYSWKGTVPPRFVPFLLVGFILLGVILGAVLNIPLAGDSNSEFSEIIVRGDVAWLMLPLIVVAIPSLIRLAYDLTRKTIDGYSNAKLRSALSHTAHVGIMLLLVGHIFTTTLVDRTDPSHQVVLVKGDELSHEGLHLTFTEWTVLSSSDEAFVDRFKVGDGFLGAEIEVRDGAGNLLEVVNPGMLRFDDSNGFPRSEVARYSSLTGDTIFIFDWSQTQELGNASDSIDMSSGDVELDRVRLTVYHLPGSHLVWAGWLMIILSSFTIWITSYSKEKDSKTPST